MRIHRFICLSFTFECWILNETRIIETWSSFLNGVFYAEVSKHVCLKEKKNGVSDVPLLTIHLEICSYYWCLCNLCCIKWDTFRFTFWKRRGWIKCKRSGFFNVLTGIMMIFLKMKVWWLNSCQSKYSWIYYG